MHKYKHKHENNSSYFTVKQPLASKSARTRKRIWSLCFYLHLWLRSGHFHREIRDVNLVFVNVIISFTTSKKQALSWIKNPVKNRLCIELKILLVHICDSLTCMSVRSHGKEVSITSKMPRTWATNTDHLCQLKQVCKQHQVTLHCYIPRLSLNKMITVIGWFLVICRDQIWMNPDQDTIAQLLPVHVWIKKLCPLFFSVFAMWLFKVRSK